VTGGLSLGGNLSADTIRVEGMISGVNSLQADTANIGGNLKVSGTVQTSNLSIPGTLDVDYVNCGTLNGDVRVNGQANVESLTVASGVTALSLECGTANVDTIDSSGIDALTVNVNDTLNVSGDLIVEGEDDRVLGESFQSLTGATMQMKHNVWYHSGTISYINVLADVDAGRVKTCYLIACPSAPLVLNGVSWLWTPVDLEDSSKTHVIALQQIGSGPVMANLAYSYPV
jgi:cytoskeletal protein CcmA (bactofilin family)